MGLDKFGFGASGIVETEKTLSEIVVSVCEPRIETGSLTITRSSFRKLPSVKKSGATVKVSIGVNGFERQKLLARGYGSVKLIGVELTGSKTNKGVGIIGLDGIGFLVKRSGLGEVLLAEIGAAEIVERVKIVRLESESLFERMDGVGCFVQLSCA